MVTYHALADGHYLAICETAVLVQLRIEITRKFPGLPALGSELGLLGYLGLEPLSLSRIHRLPLGHILGQPIGLAGTGLLPIGRPDLGRLDESLAAPAVTTETLSPAGLTGTAALAATLEVARPGWGLSSSLLAASLQLDDFGVLRRQGLLTVSCLVEQVSQWVVKVLVGGHDISSLGLWFSFIMPKLKGKASRILPFLPLLCFSSR